MNKLVKLVPLSEYISRWWNWTGKMLTKLIFVFKFLWNVLEFRSIYYYIGSGFWVLQPGVCFRRFFPIFLLYFFPPLFLLFIPLFGKKSDFCCVFIFLSSCLSLSLHPLLSRFSLITFFLKKKVDPIIQPVYSLLWSWKDVCVLKVLYCGVACFVLVDLMKFVSFLVDYSLLRQFYE